MAALPDLRFSFIIPALNEETCIGACIRSIQAQDAPPHEIIVVDNGCTDRTAELARQLGGTVIGEGKPGLSHARNGGARAASGDILCFIDADGTLAPGWLRAARWSFAQSHIGAVSGPSIYVHPHLRKRLWHNTELKTLPNQMTAIRFVLLPILWVFALLNLPTLIGLGTVITFITDVLDGYFARKLGQVSAFGSKFDSLADNLLILSGLMEMQLTNLVVNNTRHVGNFSGFRRARLGDGRSDVLLADSRLWSQLLQNLGLLTRTYLWSPGVELQARALHVRATAPLRLMLDGEIWNRCMGGEPRGAAGEAVLLPLAWGGPAMTARHLQVLICYGVFVALSVLLALARRRLQPTGAGVGVLCDRRWRPKHMRQ